MFNIIITIAIIKIYILTFFFIAGNFVNDNTLTVYIKRIREKIDDKDGNIIQTIRGIGYKVVDKK